jgi:hypothetical protein
MAAKVWRAVNAAALVCLVGWVGYDALGTNVFGSRPWPDTMVDYHILHEQSAYLVTHRSYMPGGADYAYPPPAAILHYTVARFPLPVAAAIWLGLTIVAALATWWLLVRMLELDQTPAWGVLVLGAYGSACYFFQWDLRSQNCNLIFLVSLVCGLYCLHRQRSAAAGFWIALSFSLKLFSLFVLPYLLWSGRRRAFAWTAAFLVVFWLVLPAAVLGAAGCQGVYAEWLTRMQRMVDYPAAMTHPILISVRRSASWLADGNARVAWLIMNGIRATWLAVCIAAAADSWFRKERPGDATGLLSDVGVLVLAPVAVSPYLEPYHAVAFAIPSILLVRAIADSRLGARLRCFAGLVFLVAALLLWIPLDWELRGLLVNAQLFCGVAAASFLSWRTRLARTAVDLRSAHEAETVPGSAAA